MEKPPPVVSILIAARPDQAVIKALDASLELEPPPGDVEILVARGKQPSAQRNVAMNAARGTFIYFLDDDSVPDKTNLARALKHFADPQVQMVGGPNVCPMDAPWLEQVFSLVLGSWLAFGPSRARYTPIGQVRPTSEKELILCNLVARREPLLQLGGFNEALYPNEENALMDELQKRGGILLYDPDLVVQRRPRSSVRAFARMLMTYGRGRAEQFRLHPTFGSALNFVPPFFLVYLLLLPVLMLALGAASLLPLGLYFIAVLAQVLVLSFRGGVVRALSTAPFILMTHILYGAGFWRGLFTRLSGKAHQVRPQVQLETIRPRKNDAETKTHK